ncbi:MAG: hypothetical protein M3N34_05815 [Pseudomonadota bacterium]|nr:hypothetical protein [Pseudomonadota bacterium]
MVDAEGAVVLRDCVASDPEVLAKWPQALAVGNRVLLELIRQHKDRMPKPGDLAAPVAARLTAIMMARTQKLLRRSQTSKTTVGDRAEKKRKMMCQ